MHTFMSLEHKEGQPPGPHVPGQHKAEMHTSSRLVKRIEDLSYGLRRPIIRAAKQKPVLPSQIQKPPTHHAKKLGNGTNRTVKLQEREARVKGTAGEYRGHQIHGLNCWGPARGGIRLHAHAARVTWSIPTLKKADIRV